MLVGHWMGFAMRTATAAPLGAGTKGITHDLADGAGTAAALGAAPQAIVDLSRRARQVAHRGGHCRPHVGVGQNIAGADDHERLAIR